MEPIVIGISGRKQSGKTTLANHLITQVGGSIVNLADPLKKLICQDILGLTNEQVNGTEEQKNSLTDYKWDNLADYLRNMYSLQSQDVFSGYACPSWDGEGQDQIELYQSLVVPRSGQMTAREVMQIVGTDIFRRSFNDNIWVDCLFRTINEQFQETGNVIFFVPDVRFVSEIDGIIKNNGYIIRLQRRVTNDTHQSEMELDNYNFAALGSKALVIGSEVDIPKMENIGLDFVTSTVLVK